MANNKETRVFRKIKSDEAFPFSLSYSLHPEISYDTRMWEGNNNARVYWHYRLFLSHIFTKENWEGLDNNNNNNDNNNNRPFIIYILLLLCYFFTLWRYCLIHHTPLLDKSLRWKQWGDRNVTCTWDTQSLQNARLVRAGRVLQALSLS